MHHGFAPVGQVDLEDEVPGLIHDFSVKVEIHESLIFLFQVLVGAHDAPVIAYAGEFHPETNRHIGQVDGLFTVMGKQPGQPDPVIDRTHFF
jgi:hypothetical protein